MLKNDVVSKQEGGIITAVFESKMEISAPATRCDVDLKLSVPPTQNDIAPRFFLSLL